MKEVLEAIERHLGRSLDIPQLDYYQVVGLELYCDDPERIRVALQAATNTWMQSETGRYPESAQIVGKLLKQAQLILLDPKKRQLYNTQLAKLRESQATAVPVTSSKSTRDAESESLFPDGDPMQPLPSSDSPWSQIESNAASDFLATVFDLETRRSELLQLFPSLADLELMARNRGSTSNGFLEQIDAPKSSTAQVPRNSAGARTLVEQIRRRRNRNRSLVAGVLVLGALGLLGFASYVFINNRARLAKQEKPPAEQRTVADSQSAEGSPLNGSASNLPRQGQEPSRSGRDAQGPRVVSNLPSVRRDEETASSVSEMKPASDAAVEPAMEPAMEPSPPEPAPPETNATTEPAATTPPPIPAPPMKELEGSEWKQHMVAARAALDEEKFKSLESEIELAFAAAETIKGKEMTARLDQLGQLYKIYVEAFEESKKKTRGTSSIKVGATAFSIVESDPQKLIVRAAGKNKTYTWDKLPFGIAAAIADLGLSESEPVDIAARAVYFSLSPAYRESAKNNDLVRKRIDEWFSKSVGKDKVRPDLRQALTDSYE